MILSNRLSFYKSSIAFIIKTFLLRKKIPFIGGIAINDSCNLHCRYCSVSNRNIPDLRFDEIKKGLKILYDKGIKNLYIEGGEPFLWKENSKNLEDIIELAHKIGFNFVSVYTNGTFAIKTKADTVFVSLDGLREINDSIRGKSFDRIIFNIENSNHKKIILNCTITCENKNEIENFCNEIKNIQNICGIYFYFYTPATKKDNLYLNKKDKIEVVTKLLKLKQKGYKILNSRPALKSVYNKKLKKPNSLSYLFAENKLYECCRFNENVLACEECGYLGFAEIYYISKLNPNAVFTAFKYI